MQPIHLREARWFWQWDRLELVRGFGYSLFFIWALFLAASLALPDSFPLPPVWSGILAFSGVSLFFGAYYLDCVGIPLYERKIGCRKCRKIFKMGRIMKNKWACPSCGTIGRFDNK